MQDKLEEIENLITKARDKIELAMLEVLDSNNNDPIEFDKPISVVNNDDYDYPGWVYKVELDSNSDNDYFVAISASWGNSTEDDVELYYVPEFSTDDLERILTRMYETIEDKLSK